MAGEESEGPKVSEYEKQRFSRIAENKARLEALLGPSLNSRGKSNPREDDDDDDDDDYRPDEADDDDDEEFLGDSTSPLPKKMKKKKKVLSSNRSYPLGLGEDDDDDLNKAIALSLQHSDAGSSATAPRKKTELISKMHITEDELVIYFYQFDEAGKGFITLRDIAKMATVHDFTWTQDELQNMICCFDIDKDGKLSLDEFRKIVKRCRMLKES